MKFFIDTEFIEDFTKPLFGKPRHYIDLISIGIVTEDGREYYAVSNEFDIDHVWNKYQLKESPYTSLNTGTSTMQKEHWLRDNVLKPIYWDLCATDDPMQAHGLYSMWGKPAGKREFTRLIREYGKSNEQIGKEIVDFVHSSMDFVPGFTEQSIDFYGYYADYDWVLFCSLYGRMLDLPKGFPMYCRDLKQMFDEAQLSQPPHINLKNDGAYPKQSNAHNALDDARWNKRLYRFLKVLQD